LLRSRPNLGELARLVELDPVDLTFCKLHDAVTVSVPGSAKRNWYGAPSPGNLKSCPALRWFSAGLVRVEDGCSSLSVESRMVRKQSCAAVIVNTGSSFTSMRAVGDQRQVEGLAATAGGSSSGSPPALPRP